MADIYPKPSILLTPTAYDNGSLHSVKPVYNEEEKFSNSFDTIETGWSYNNNILTGVNTPNNAISIFNTSISTKFKVSFKVNDLTGILFFKVNNTSLSNAVTLANGVYEYKGVVTGAFPQIVFDGASASPFSGTITDISIKQLTEADFDFTRGSSATRVNEKGLIEDVQILSGNLVQNGDFSQIGSELVTNGSFDTDSDWSLTGGWSVGNGKASNDGTGGILRQSNTVQLNTRYKVVFTVSNYVTGDIQIKLAPEIKIVQITGNGTYTVYTDGANSINRDLQVIAVNSFQGSIDNVSVKEVGQNWTFNTGWSVESGKAVFDASLGSAGYIIQSNALQVGKKYKLTANVNKGTVVLISAFYNIQQGTNIQTGVDSIFTVISGTDLRLYSHPNNGDSEITNISVIEITDDTDLPRINYTNFDYEDVLGNELVTNGSFSDDSDWNKGTGWTISDGKAIKTGTVASNFDQLNTGVFTNNKTYKITFNISNSNDGRLLIYIGGNSVTIDITNATNGTHTFYAKADGENYLIFRNDTSGFQGSIDNVSVKELTEDVVVPYSGEGSLLLEPQSTNLFPYSEDFTQWALGTNSTLTFESNVIAPDGSLGVYRLQNPQTGSTFLTGGVRNCRNFSLFVKAVTEGVNNQFNLDGSGQPTDTKTATTKWQRFDRDFGTQANYNLSINNGIDNYASDIYIWGAQAEALSYATSYIVSNSGSTTTRLADLCNNAGSSDLINSTEGVLYMDGARFKNDFNYCAIMINDDSINNVVGLKFRNTENLLIATSRNSGVSTDIFYTFTDVSLFNKIALRYNSNSLTLFVNGQQVGNVLNPNIPSNLTNLELKEPNENFYGKVKSVAVFKEALDNDQLERLTGEGYETFNLLAQANNYTII